DRIVLLNQQPIRTKGNIPRGVWITRLPVFVPRLEPPEPSQGGGRKTEARPCAELNPCLS
ncbi:MAG: hypothetical protein KKF88_12750, partial [Alphaproteobacteria bacterium]|nr:hypothetical protein [Alphaproteobacteria bacterium]